MVKHILVRLKYAVAGTSLLVTVFALPLAAQAQHIQPAYRYTVTPDVPAGSSSFTFGMTTSSTAVYSVGTFVGTVDFGGPGINSVSTQNGSVFVTKYENNGSYDWTRTFDTATGGGSAQPAGVVAAPDGSIYIAGTFSGGVTFDGPGGSDSQNVTGSGTFITKYSSSGAYMGTTTIVPPANGAAAANSIAIDNQGNVYVAGSFNGSVNFAGNSGSDTKTDASGSGNTFVTRYNANGSYGGTKTFDTSPGGGTYGQHVAVDQSGDVYVGGNYYGAVNFAGGSGSDTLSDPNGNVFITKYSANGAYAWTKTFTNSQSSYVGLGSIATDPNGNVYAAGNFGGAVNFAGGSGSDTQTDAGGSGDAFLTKYSSGGAYGGTHSFDTSAGGYTSAQAVTTDINGDVYVLSAYGGAVNFAGNSGTDDQNQSSDGAVTMYEPDGSYAWTRVFDTTNGTAVVTQGVYPGLTTDAIGNLYIGSVFTGTVGFDGPGGSDTQTTSGYETSFLTSYHTFVPIVATQVPPISTNVSSASHILPPNTGYGIASENHTMPLYVTAVAAVTIGLAFIARRLPSTADVRRHT